MWELIWMSLAPSQLVCIFLVDTTSLFSRLNLTPSNALYIPRTTLVWLFMTGAIGNDGAKFGITL